MSEEIENIQFELTDDLINQVERLIEVNDDKALQKLLKDFHYADIAEILDELDLDGIYYKTSRFRNHCRYLNGTR